MLGRLWASIARLAVPYASLFLLLENVLLLSLRSGFFFQSI